MEQRIRKPEQNKISVNDGFAILYRAYTNQQKAQIQKEKEQKAVVEKSIGKYASKDGEKPSPLPGKIVRMPHNSDGESGHEAHYGF